MRRVLAVFPYGRLWTYVTIVISHYQLGDHLWYLVTCCDQFL